MAAHRYWRVYSYRNSGATSYAGITELEFRGAAGGPDLTGTGTAISSGGIQAGSAAAAFDNNAASIIQWQNFGAGAWIGYDFGAGNEQEIVEIAILPNKDLAHRTFYDFAVEWSDDGIVWTASWFGSIDTAWVIGTWKVFTRPPVTGPARFWRVRAVTLGSGSDMSCGELEMREASGGADATSPVAGRAYSRTTYSGSYTADKAFDNNNNTLYSGSGGFNGAEFLRYDFTAGNEKIIREILWRSRHDGDAYQNPTDARVESSLDGVSFAPRWAWASSGWTSNTARIFAAPPVVIPRRRMLTLRTWVEAAPIAPPPPTGDIDGSFNWDASNGTPYEQQVTVGPGTVSLSSSFSGSSSTPQGGSIEMEVVETGASTSGQLGSDGVDNSGTLTLPDVVLAEQETWTIRFTVVRFGIGGASAAGTFNWTTT